MVLFVCCRLTSRVPLAFLARPSRYTCVGPTGSRVGNASVAVKRDHVLAASGGRHASTSTPARPDARQTGAHREVRTRASCTQRLDGCPNRYALAGGDYTRVRLNVGASTSIGSRAASGDKPDAACLLLAASVDFSPHERVEPPPEGGWRDDQDRPVGVPGIADHDSARHDGNLNALTVAAASAAFAPRQLQCGRSYHLILLW